MLSALLLFGCIDKYSGDTDEPVDPPTQPVLVGPDGGTFNFGTAVAVIPEGALTEEIEIRIYETDDDPPGEYDALSKVWSAEPHGLVFETPITVRLPYEPANADNPQMYWSNDDGGYDRLETFTNDEGGVARAFVEHFSTAFVAQIATEIVEEPEPYPPADVLFIVDNSCSMIEEQTALAAAMPAVLPSVEATGLDFHLGVVSTDMVDTANHAGKLQQAAGVSYIDPTTPDPTAVFTSMAVMGTNGDFNEQGRAAAYTMVEIKPDIPRNLGFYRDEATLTFIFVSDEPDFSDANPVTGTEFRDWMDTKKARPEDMTAHGFFWEPGTQCPTASEPGPQYQSYVDYTGGVSASICQSDWATDLEAMFQSLLNSARVELPQPAASVESVTFEGANSVTLAPAEYTWDPATNTVYFDQGVRPDMGETVQVEYTPL